MFALLLPIALGTTPQYAWPTTQGAWVTSHFDNARGTTSPRGEDYVCGQRAYRNHKGTDIGSGRHTTVRAAAAGVVVRIEDGWPDGWFRNYDHGFGFGNHVVIDHGDGNMTIYGHLQAHSGLPSVGDHVSCGQAIGAVGTSGNSTGPHLHFETRTGTDGQGLFTGIADDPYSGLCGGHISFWTNQNRGNPTTECADGGGVEPDACDGRGNGDWCDGDDVITCSAGREVGREVCANGCEGMPFGTPDRCAAEPPDACDGLIDGLWCDGDDLVVCDDGDVVQRESCDEGCTSMPFGTPDECAEPPDACDGLIDGLWCDGDDLIDCDGGLEISRETCAAGCESMPFGTADRCFPEPTDNSCLTLPPEASPDPADGTCNLMDWERSPDGYYLISRFGADTDHTTEGHTTTCGWLQSHYDFRGCIWNAQTNSCEPGSHDIPWVQGHVDHSASAMFTANDLHRPGDVPHPEWFYVAGAQRFGCGQTLRVTNPENGLCVVAYAEDGGPNGQYEDAQHGGRRILDASPAISDYLEVERWGWADADMVFVEMGQPGDVPGRACPSTCAAEPADVFATPSIWDVDHMLSNSCR